jgi:hypothetical protein
MPEITVDQALEICIEKINNKTATIAECLREFPQFEQELREILPLTISVKTLQAIKPSQQFSINANNRLASKLSDHPVTFWGFIRHIIMKQTYQPNRRFGMPQIIESLIVAISLLIGGSFAVDASAPGDLLYDLDLAMEQFRVRITGSPEKATTLRIQNATERLEEAEKKLQKGDIENATRALEAYNIAMKDFVGNEEAPVRQEVRTMTQEDGALQQGTLDRIRLSQPEEAQARNAFQEELQRANQGVEKLFGPPEKAPQGPSEDVPQGPNSEDGKGPSEEAPQGPPEDAPQGPTEEAPKSPPEDAPQGPTDDGSNGSTKNKP